MESGFNEIRHRHSRRLLPTSRRSRSAARRRCRRRNMPAMDEIAAAGVVGRANNVPVACRRVGRGQPEPVRLRPARHFTGRAPLEAAAQGIELGPDDWAIRCNLVTIEDQTMRSFTAGHISTDEATRAAGDRAGAARQRATCSSSPASAIATCSSIAAAKQPAPFHARHAGHAAARPDRQVACSTIFPRGPGSDLLNELMSDSVALFADHPVNAARKQAGKLPATNVWLWGLGSTPALTPFHEAARQARAR